MTAPTTTRSSRAVLELAEPGSGSGSRRSRRDHGRRDRRRRRRRILVLVAKVLAGMVAIALLVAGTALVAVPAVQRALDSRGDAADERGTDGADTASDDTTSVTPAGSARALIVQENGAGRLVGVTVVAGDGNILFVPVGSMVEVPSFGLQALRVAHRDGGVGLLRSSLENLLGAQFDVVEVLGPDEVEQLVEPVGPLGIDVPHAVEVVDDDGRVEVLFRKGENRVEPSQVGRLLAEQGGVADLDRLVRHEAFWRAWLAAVADTGGAGTPDDLGDLGDVIAGLATGEVEYHLLPVEAVAGGVAADDGLYRVRQADLDELLARILPESSTVGGRIRVQVLNGTGEPGISQRIQPELVGAGAAVTLTGNADRFDYEETQIVYYQDDQLAAARAVREALGFGEVVKSLSGMVVVDVTVVVGEDFADDRPADKVEAEPGDDPAAGGEGA